jgi:hypothetical protein
MNDFTKDELEIILNGLLWRDATILPIDRPEKLKSKIQSMIDNYPNPKCDHEFKLCRCFYGVDENRYRCNKCLIAYEDLNDN